MLFRIFYIFNTQDLKIIFRNSEEGTTKYPDKVTYLHDVCTSNKTCKSLNNH